jgi:hypothetical protein
MTKRVVRVKETEGQLYFAYGPVGVTSEEFTFSSKAAEELREWLDQGRRDDEMQALEEKLSDVYGELEAAMAVVDGFVSLGKADTFGEVTKNVPLLLSTLQCAKDVQDGTGQREIKNLIHTLHDARQNLEKELQATKKERADLLNGLEVLSKKLMQVEDELRASRKNERPSTCDC